MGLPPVKKPRRGMLPFYVGAGVVALLFVGFYFAWTPLRVRYLEHKIARMAPGSIEDVRVPEFRKLADCGPPARDAFKRLTSSSPSLRWAALSALGTSEDTWALPLVIDAVSAKQEDVSNQAIGAAERIMNVQSLMGHGVSYDDYRALRIKRVLTWWNREGKAKYGRGK